MTVADLTRPPERTEALWAVSEPSQVIAVPSTGNAARPGVIVDVLRNVGVSRMQSKIEKAAPPVLQTQLWLAGFWSHLNCKPRTRTEKGWY